LRKCIAEVEDRARLSVVGDLEVGFGELLDRLAVVRHLDIHADQGELAARPRFAAST
jgi:hypothetical protein